ncbi:uncharacterized protein [Prorops nasuta]|uniref:uncharacterized protein n=1 Tax=Prorops nasuta TaxID=863751 RepID=UPI0034CEAAEF
MDSFEDDLFAFSDEDQLEPPKSNPIAENLMKKLFEIQTFVEGTRKDIENVQNATKEALDNLLFQAKYAKKFHYNSDSEFNNAKFKKTLKMRKILSNYNTLIVKQIWQRVFDMKWVIGVLVQNLSKRTLRNLRLYCMVKEQVESYGASSFWCIEENGFWTAIDAIQGNADDIVATFILDLPKFNETSFVELCSTISYEVGERELQVGVMPVKLTAEDTINGGDCALNFTNEEGTYSILAIKSAAVQAIIGIDIKAKRNTGPRVLALLADIAFKEVHPDVFLNNEPGSLLYCLIEILPIIDGIAKLNISARSKIQLNIILCIIRDKFAGSTVECKDESCVKAANSIVEELELYLNLRNQSCIQLAQIRTDLLIP